MATASNTQRAPREVIEFAPNVPVTVALRYNQGKHIAGQYGDRMMFSTTDGRIFFLDPFVAGKIEAAGINVRESFTITKKWDGVQGSTMTWEIARIPGEQPNGTFAVPMLGSTQHLAAPSESPAATAQNLESTVARGRQGGLTPKPPASATSAAPSDGRSLLVREADALVDAYALVLERALTTYQGRIKPDEVRSLLLSAYIQRRQLSSVA
jgi:hypothetical protein